MAERINVSTRLTEVYRKIEPASGSEYFPFADSKGREYVLFTAADGSIGYYCEESNGFVVHALNASGTVTSFCGIPLPANGKLKPGVAYFSVVQKDGKRVFYIVDQNEDGQLEASISSYPGIALGSASGFCGDQGMVSLVGDSGKYSDEKQLDYINVLIDGGACTPQTVGYRASYNVGPAAFFTPASGKAWPMHMLVAHPKSAGEEWRPALKFALIDSRVGTGQCYIPKDMAPCDVVDM